MDTCSSLTMGDRADAGGAVASDEGDRGDGPLLGQRESRRRRDVGWPRQAAAGRGRPGSDVDAFTRGHVCTRCKSVSSLWVGNGVLRWLDQVVEDHGAFVDIVGVVVSVVVIVSVVGVGSS